MIEITNNRFFSSKFKPETTKLQKHQLLNSCLEKLTPPQGCNFFPPRPCGTLCDCCVSPLQSVLRQLVGQTVILLTVADPPNTVPLLFFVTITDVNDFLVTVTDGMTTSVVSIADVVAVAIIPPGPNINLTRPVNFQGKCDCRERPLRQLFDSLVGSSVDIRLSQGSVAENFNVERTGLGIVFGQLFLFGVGITANVAISLCQITDVNTDPTPTVASDDMFFTQKKGMKSSK
ncbi:hypothetical protein [Peribacillus simplex]|uniref:hypothetical protein n=1 Tax=Peribacillus simplex TaxID=1478 RepID=UPI0024C13160|nr:hypothetical protein [Peribacillus simplex]WHY55717.1 hypothetical protein QNH43_21610 [Peribacillus simplex]